ncbi:Mannosylglucosyl-3-phosphoglycerate phosphatase [Tolypocladium paradoxum]|uniref:Mannosylglucosyl-3-phosphoglycerate phosphatase n=1 Tax=Tolypocladium paradoxum TaxID=94208 RepID=A0A2S4L8Z9_9HYPO|nr:Mannosylglucosyl-3-phosphoglycerate phosphatase [Tolypocladium paradoxum]
MGREKKKPTSKPQAIYASGRVNAADAADLRLLHYNDVYHVDSASAEPVGGVARFMTLVKEYQEGARFRGQPRLLTLFSGDAFNPSLESSVTKGRHMVPVLNAIGTDCACVGNHDFDFGVKQFRYLADKCSFPWLLANVLDPALGEDVPLGNAKRTHMLTASNGIKVGLIGLGEREWLATINSLPPNLIYKSASATAKELVPKLREQGAEIVICLSHMREPNDKKLAEQTDGIIDVILGGHDHYYSHGFVKGTHVLRSGTDFKQLSYIEARRRDGSKRWDLDVWRRDVTSDVPEHEPSAKLVKDLTSKLQRSLSRPIGWTAMPLDARFGTVRVKESNIGNFVCDVMRRYHNADCTMMASGTIRGDQIYPPGAVRIKDITNCFPFEDPVVLLRVKGQAIRDALENGVSTYPALEGRFPQVSHIKFEFDPRRKSGNRVTSMSIGGEAYDPERKYLLATRGYMGRGKDGYVSLLVTSEGGEAEEIVDEENGILISAMLRQYFMGLRTVGQWKRLSDHWVDVAEEADVPLSPTRTRDDDQADHNCNVLGLHKSPRNQDEAAGTTWRGFLRQRLGFNKEPLDDDDDDHFDPHKENGEEGGDAEDRMDLEILLMRKFWTRWALKAGVKASVCDPLTEGEFTVDWTRVIAPCLEGRIKMVGSTSRAYG